MCLLSRMGIGRSGSVTWLIACLHTPIETETHPLSPSLLSPPSPSFVSLCLSHTLVQLDYSKFFSVIRNQYNINLNVDIEHKIQLLLRPNTIDKNIWIKLENMGGAELTGYIIYKYKSNTNLRVSFICKQKLRKWIYNLHLLVSECQLARRLGVRWGNWGRLWPYSLIGEVLNDYKTNIGT